MLMTLAPIYFAARSPASYPGSAVTKDLEGDVKARTAWCSGALEPANGCQASKRPPGKTAFHEIAYLFLIQAGLHVCPRIHKSIFELWLSTRSLRLYVAGGVNRGIWKIVSVNQGGVESKQFISTIKKG